MTNAKKAKTPWGEAGADAGKKTRAAKTKAARKEAERRRQRQRTLWVVVGVVVIVAVAIAGILLPGGDEPAPSFGPSSPDEIQIESRATGEPLVVGDVIPQFSAPGLEGGTVNWLSYVGKPTVLVVWASWCPHCQRELPKLVPTVQDTAASLVSVTTAIGQEPGPTPPEFLDEEGLDLTTAVDDEQSTLMQGLGVSGFPTVFYVGKDGKIAAITSGEVPQEQVSEHLLEIGVR
jgi:thiol-disulfide isomerase/thioredoxin